MRLKVNHVSAIVAGVAYWLFQAVWYQLLWYNLPNDEWWIISGILKHEKCSLSR